MESIAIDRRITKWKNLKQRLGLKAMGCCGATWSPRGRISNISILEEDEDEEAAQRQQVNISRSGNVVNNSIQNQTENSVSTPLLAGQRQQQQLAPTTGSGMNLAMALEAERNLGVTNVGHSAPEVKTLMRLIEETEDVDWNKKKRKDNVVVNNVEGIGVGGGGSCDWMCSVCMERKKGAAFIPCGHTFCRVCSREVWDNRSSCPVCNRSILDILDLF